MFAVSPLTPVRFNSGGRPYQSPVMVPEEDGMGTRFLKGLASVAKQFLPYSLQETSPPRQVVYYGDQLDPVVLYYLNHTNRPAEDFRLFLEA